MSSFSLQGEAVFSVGNFWEAEACFRRAYGVVSTDVGYSGGSLDSPTYHNVGDHSESVRVYFDQRRVSYDELLALFWKLYDAEPADVRYANRIFYISSEQQEAAQRGLEARINEDEKRLEVSIEPFQRFWVAEEYHQSYLAKLAGDR